MSVAPVPDERLYDTIYQERYMGLPQENEAAYHDGSPLFFADSLRGNLLVVHGSGDDNVHFQGTERLINALVAANRPFTLMVYPNRTHCICEGEGTGCTSIRCSPGISSRTSRQAGSDLDSAPTPESGVRRTGTKVAFSPLRCGVRFDRRRPTRRLDRAIPQATVSRSRLQECAPSALGRSRRRTCEAGRTRQRRYDEQEPGPRHWCRYHGLVACRL